MTTAANASGVHWDLSPLAPDAATAMAQIATALEDCRAFEAAYRGTVATMDLSLIHI